MIQLSNYVYMYAGARENIHFGLSIFDASSDISSYACQSSDKFFFSFLFFFIIITDRSKPVCELHLIL